MEQGGQVASCAGISGSCERDTCNYRACFSVCVEVTGVISPTALALNVLAECRGSVLYCIPQSVLGNGQTDALRTDWNLLSKLAATPWSFVELTNQPPLLLLLFPAQLSLSCRGGCSLQLQVSLLWNLPFLYPDAAWFIVRLCDLMQREQGSVWGAFSQGTWVFCIMIKGVSLQKESEVGSKPSWKGQHLHFLSVQYQDWNGKLIVEGNQKKMLSFSFMYLFLQPRLVLVILNFHASQLHRRHDVGIMVMVFCWFGMDGNPVWSYYIWRISDATLPLQTCMLLIHFFFKDASKILLFDWNWQSITQSVTYRSLLRVARNQYYIKFGYLDFRHTWQKPYI